MNYNVPVFQFEIRYNHILNFSQIARDLLAPYVKLTQSIKIDKQNTIEETYWLNFDDEGYLLIISWDRMVIRAQGDLNLYTESNSPVESLYFDIFKKISKMPEFGSVQRSLFYGIGIAESDKQDDHLRNFTGNTFKFDPVKVLDGVDDTAIVLESKSESKTMSITFGPYWGKNDILKREIKPINPALLEDVDFQGIMMEYKQVLLETNVSFDNFKNRCKEFNNTFKEIWKIQ
ncbi:MAG: hypothetical protein HKO81_06580 [Flavobacteriaceae bacterium]|nr:hypothetical protein [Bacteroidia bacterium]NNL16291.1 hypothetical protein [Flavobacteriaceae bacterium]